jgi:hypothetical protein
MDFDLSYLFQGDVWGVLMGTGGFSFDEEDNYRYAHREPKLLFLYF